MGMLALAEGDLGLVTSELNTARSLGCPSEKLDRVHALSLSRIGRYDEAEPILVELYRVCAGGDPAVDEVLARVYLMTYRLKEAEKVIQQWIRDAPRDGRPYLWLTEFDRRMEVDNAEALERHYRQALERDPELDAARIGLAETLRKGHSNAEAMKEYELYLEHRPDEVVALAGAGRVAVELDDRATSARFLDKALTIAPRNVEALRGRAALDVLQGDLAGALSRLDLALQIDPYDTEGYYTCRPGPWGSGRLRREPGRTSRPSND